MNNRKRIRLRDWWIIGMILCFALCGAAGEEGEMTMITNMQYDALRLAKCDMERFDPENPRFTEKMLLEATAFLEETLARKYADTEFMLTACVRRGLNQEYDEFQLVPNGDETSVFMARIFGSGKNLSCRDSYYGVLKTAEYEALLREKTDALASGLKVFSTIDLYLDEEHDAAFPLAQAMEEDGFFAYTWILVPSETPDFNGLSAELEKTMRESGLKGDYAVYSLTEHGNTISDKSTAFERIPKNQDEYSEIRRFIVR